ncbi:TetR/AcrR family transcriptional regulator [Streptomyces sp. NPDC001536]|uniref:TetR/AcrR family transcriptional regulator n=1 Tax=Streptomyces sp. NPDC001536 TaxID=3364583 RepID=UPI0036AAE737
MGRVSQAQAQENRRRVVDTASRLFREQGTHVSVADLMKEAGLTHGAFYKQFASKEALVDEVTAHAIDEWVRCHAAPFEQYGGRRDAAQRDLIDAYLSSEHRDNAADGCPVAALAADVARAPEDREARRTYTQGVADLAAYLAPADAPGGEGGEEGFVRLCTLVGALLLSRATQGSPLSDDILAAARAALAETA